MIPPHTGLVSGREVQMEVLKRLWDQHPNLVSWFILALGMIIILIWAARDVGFTPGQWAALIGATILLAGLSVWIISWEEGEDTVEDNGREA